MKCSELSSVLNYLKLNGNKYCYFLKFIFLKFVILFKKPRANKHNAHNKLECYIKLDWKALAVANNLAYLVYS
jgi:hypothetical protein